MNAHIDGWLTVEEAADRLRVSTATVRRWIRHGKLTKHTVAGLQSVRIRRSEVDALIRPVLDDEPTQHAG